MKPTGWRQWGWKKTKKPSLTSDPIQHTVSNWWGKISRNLSGISDTPSLDAQVLLAHILNKPRSWVLAHPEANLDNQQEQQVGEALDRLLAGEPLPYVLGHWEFFGLDFQVTHDTLIPRPETELIVEQALQWLNQHPVARNAIDVGTGSGCIAISLTAHLPDLRCVATDLSPAALRVAQDNAERHGVTGRIKFIQADLFQAFDPQGSSFAEMNFDLIVANLPYVPTDTLRESVVFVCEPGLALDGGPDGMDLIRRLLTQAPTYLAPDGLLLFEIEYRQATQAQLLARAAFPQAQLVLFQDLAGHDRVIGVQSS